MLVVADDHRREVERGERFEFGDNWSRFLRVVDEQRIAEAERSLEELLGAGTLRGASFVDVGCGSGLFSLAAMRLGASRVHSLDFDPESVACARELRRRYVPGSDAWTIEQASALDREHLGELGTYDVVYSWGVLHHTGAMWTAMENVASVVGADGRLFISIYNDQGLQSRVWRWIKRLYNALPELLRTPFVIAVMLPIELRSLVLWIARRQPMGYVRRWTDYKRARGMSRWYDLVDWVGGYPFEVATRDAVIGFLEARGFALERLVPRDGIGCNEFVFRRSRVG